MIQYPPSQNWTSFSRWALFLRKFNMWVFAMLAALSNDIILAWPFAWILRFPSFECQIELYKNTAVCFSLRTRLCYIISKNVCVVAWPLQYVCDYLCSDIIPFFFSVIFLLSGVKLLPTTNILLGNRAWATKRPKLDMIKDGFLIKDYKNHTLWCVENHWSIQRKKIVLRYLRHTRGKKLFREIGCLKIVRNNLRYMAEI